MPKAILEFDLSDPDDKERFELACKAQKMAIALEEIQSEVFRPARKHGYSDAAVESIIEKIESHIPKGKDELLEIDCSELIWELEKIFCEIIDKNDLGSVL